MGRQNKLLMIIMFIFIFSDLKSYSSCFDRGSKRRNSCRKFQEKICSSARKVSSYLSKKAKRLYFQNTINHQLKRSYAIYQGKSFDLSINALKVIETKMDLFTDAEKQTFYLLLAQNQLAQDDVDAAHHNLILAKNALIKSYSPLEYSHDFRFWGNFYDPSVIISSMISISQIYMENENYSKSIKLLKEALGIEVEGIYIEESLKVSILRLIALCYFKSHKLKLCKKYLLRVFLLLEEDFENKKEELHEILKDLSRIRMILGQKTILISCYKKIIKRIDSDHDISFDDTLLKIMEQPITIFSTLIQAGEKNPDLLSEMNQLCVNMLSLLYSFKEIDEDSQKEIKEAILKALYVKSHISLRVNKIHEHKDCLHTIRNLLDNQRAHPLWEIISFQLRRLG